jgi:hypothetical protein
MSLCPLVTIAISWIGLRRLRHHRPPDRAFGREGEPVGDPPRGEVVSEPKRTRSLPGSLSFVHFPIAVIRAARLSCQNAGKTQKFSPLLLRECRFTEQNTSPKRAQTA